MLKRAATAITALAVAAFAAQAPKATAQGLIRDTEIESLIWDYSTPLFQAAGIPPSSVDILLINDPSLNAFASVGPLMGVNTGLILQAETPNEVIGVIAHETGHIAGGHILRGREAAGKSAAPMILGLLLGVAAIAAGAPEAGIGALGLSQQFAQNQYLSFSRVIEASADQAALDYLEATEQSAHGMIAFFERFRYQEALSRARRFEYFLTHPLSSDRIAMATRRAEASAYWRRPDSAESMHRLRMVQAKIRGFLQPPEYTFRYYPPSDQSLAARYARAIATYRVPHTQKAVVLIEELIAEQPDNPYFHELLGQALFESGRAGDAIEPLRRSVELAPRAPLLRILLARALIAIEDPALYDEADQHLDRALAYERRNPTGWRVAADLHARRGETALANLATAERFFSIGQVEPARQFAARARRELDRGSPSWQRATDILIAGLSNQDIEAATRNEE